MWMVHVHTCIFLFFTMYIINHVCVREGGLRKFSLTSILVDSHLLIPIHVYHNTYALPFPYHQSSPIHAPPPLTLRLPVRATLHRRLIIKLKTCMTNKYIHVCIVKITGKVLRARVWRKRDYKNYFLLCTLSVVFVLFILNILANVEYAYTCTSTVWLHHIYLRSSWDWLD